MKMTTTEMAETKRKVFVFVGNAVSDEVRIALGRPAWGVGTDGHSVWPVSFDFTWRERGSRHIVHVPCHVATRAQALCAANRHAAKGFARLRQIEDHMTAGLSYHTALMNGWFC